MTCSIPLGGPKVLEAPKNSSIIIYYEQSKPSNKINFKSGLFEAQNILVAPKKFGGPQKFWWPLKKSLKI